VKNGNKTLSLKRFLDIPVVNGYGKYNQAIKTGCKSAACFLFLPHSVTLHFDGLPRKRAGNA
jgi:hypothetical protein